MDMPHVDNARKTLTIVEDEVHVANAAEWTSADYAPTRRSILAGGLAMALPYPGNATERCAECDPVSRSTA